MKGRNGGPYQGLVPYSEDDAPFFFGREADRELLIANLRGSRLTLLYGASGVGKSSLLRAGIVYHLRQLARQNLEEQGTPDLALAMFDTWQGDPMPGLLRAVQEGVEQALPEKELTPVPPSLGLVSALRAWSEQLGGNLLILLDQFEEYFLYHPQDGGPGGFADELARAVNEPDLRVGFLIAIREDALAWLDRFKGRIPGLFANYLRLDHLERDEARRAIVRPIEEYSRRSGEPFKVEPKLVEKVLDQVAVGKVTVGEVGQGLPTTVQPTSEKRIEAPYLQLVMSRIWDEETSLGSRVLRRESLDKLGGAERIVQTHLDATLSALSSEEQEVAARMFRYLVTPRGAKVALTVGDLAGYTDLTPGQLTPVLNRLAQRDVRILRQVADQPETPRYEIFHDVLAAPVLDWRRRLERFEEKERLQQEQRRVRWLWSGITVLALLLLAMMALTHEVLRQNRQVETARSEANLRVLIARTYSLAHEALSMPDPQLDLAFLLSVQANPPRGGNYAAQNSLLTLLQRDPQLTAFLHCSDTSLTVLAFSPDGETLAAGGTEPLVGGSMGVVCLWSRSTHRLLGIIVPRHEDAIRDLVFSPDGRTLASIGGNGTLHLWSVASRRQIGRPIKGHRGGISSMAFSPDSGTLAWADTDGISLWSVASRQPIGQPLQGSRGVSRMVFSPDGKTLASAEIGGTIRLWSVDTGQPLGELLTGHANTVTNLAFRSSGKVLVSVGTDGAMVSWSVETRQPLRRSLTSPEDAMRDTAFNSDGRILAWANDKVVSFWAVDTHQKLGEIVTGHRGFKEIAISPDGRTLASAGSDGTVRLWSWERRQRLGQALSPVPGFDPGLVSSVAFSRDSRVLALGGDKGAVHLWSVDTRRPLGQPLLGHGDTVKSVAFSPDGKILAAAGGQTIRFWSFYTRLPIGQPLIEKEGAIQSIAFSPDGRIFASAINQMIRLWSVDNRQPLGQIRTEQDGVVSSIAFSLDSRTLVSGNFNGTIRFWDVGSLQPDGLLPEQQVLTGHEGPVTSVAFSSSRGGILAAGGSDGTVRLWHVDKRRPLERPLLGHDDAVTSVAFSPKGYIMASGSLDKTVRLWDVGEGRQLGRPLTGHEFNVFGVAFSPNGRWLASAGDDGEVYLWDVSLDSWRDRACGIANRNLSAWEWLDYLESSEREKTCPKLALDW